MPEAATRNAPPADEVTFVDRIRLYRREIIAAAVIFVGVMLIYGVATSIQEAAEDKAHAAFFKVEFDNMNNPSLDLAKEMAAARVKHAGTRAVAYAYLREFNEHMRKDEYDRADQSAREFLKEFPDHMFAPEIKFNRAKILMHKGDIPAATDIINGLKGLGLSWLEPQLKLAEVQCLEQKAEKDKTAPNYQKQLERIRDMYIDIKEFGRNRGWPGPICSEADFALVVMRDRIAGREPSMPPEKAKAPPPPKPPLPSAPALPGLKPKVEPGVADVPAAEKGDSKTPEVEPAPDAENKADVKDNAEAGNKAK